MSECVCRLSFAVVQSRCSRFRHGLTTEGERHIERWSRRSGRIAGADNIRADSQPIRRKSPIPDPRLSIECKRSSRNGPLPRQVEEVAVRQRNLGAKKILTRRQDDWPCEGDSDLDFLTSDRSLTARID